MKCPNDEVQGSQFLSPFILCLFVLLFLMGIPGNLYAADLTVIRVLERAEIDNDEILLGRIAEIKGEDQEMVRTLQAIAIGTAPLPGTTLHIDEAYIKIRLKQNRVDLYHISLEGAKNIEVSRGSVEISKEMIEKVALDFIYKKIPWDRNAVSVKGIRVSNRVILPKGKITYKVIPPKKTDYLGTITLSVHFEVNGHFKKRVWAAVNIEVLTKVVVTKKPLGRYQPIKEGDIHYKKMDLADLPSNAITNLEEVLGKRTRRRVDTDVVLRSDLIELPPLVNRGDVVLMVAESDGLRITALGEVKGKGRLGERIRVINFDSKKAIYARVLDSNTVKVDF